MYLCSDWNQKARLNGYNKVYNIKLHYQYAIQQNDTAVCDIIDLI